MPDDPTIGIGKEEQGLDPRPDPWGSRAANTAQAVGTGAGAMGAALLASSDTSGSPSDDASLALLPDPADLFGRVAHVLGFQFETPATWRWSLMLVILCVVLNLFSLWLRYRHAQQVEQEYAARLAAQQAAEDAVKRQMAAPQTKAQGFIGGDA